MVAILLCKEVVLIEVTPIRVSTNRISRLMTSTEPRCVVIRYCVCGWLAMAMSSEACQGVRLRNVIVSEKLEYKRRSAAVVVVPLNR